MKKLSCFSFVLIFLAGGCKLKNQLNVYNEQQKLQDSLFLVIQEERKKDIPVNAIKSDSLYERLNSAGDNLKLGELKTNVDSAVQFIETLKTRLRSESSGKEGDMNTPIKIMIEERNASKLKSVLEDLASRMNELSPVDFIKFNFMHEVPESVTTTWEEYNFYKVPMISVLTILTYHQQNIKKAEHDLLVLLYERN